MENYFFKERSEKLCDILVPHIFTGFHDLYKNAKRLNHEMGRASDKVLITFQLCLKRIPDIPHYQLEKDYSVLAERLKRNGFPHDWLQKVITDIFTAYAKSHLISLGASDKIKIRKIDLNIPENADFIHKCYVECARCFWQEPYLFSDNYSSMEVQKNGVLAQQKIKECIYKTIRFLVPLDQLVSIYHVGNSESIAESAIDIPLDDRDRDRDESMARSKLQRLLDSELGSDGKPKKDNKSNDQQHKISYAELNRENLDKLQKELAKNTLVQRSKTLSTVSTHHTKSVDDLLKQANDKIQEVKKVINENNKLKGSTEIEHHLDKKMSKISLETTEDDVIDPNIKSITIKKRGDYSSSISSTIGDESKNTKLGSEMTAKLNRVHELLQPQRTATELSKDVSVKSSRDESHLSEINDTNDLEESQTTIEISLNKETEKVGGNGNDDVEIGDIDVSSSKKETDIESADDGDNIKDVVSVKDSAKEATLAEDEREEKNIDEDTDEKEVIDEAMDEEDTDEVTKMEVDKKKRKIDSLLAECDPWRVKLNDLRRLPTICQDVSYSLSTTTVKSAEKTADLEQLDTLSTTSTTSTTTVKTSDEISKSNIDSSVLERQQDKPKHKSMVIDLLGTNNLYQLLEKARTSADDKKDYFADEIKSIDDRNLEDAIIHPNKKIK